MADSPGILVDSSVWVKFFRTGRAPEAIHLEGLIQAAAVKTCAPVRAEVLSGAPTLKERTRLRELFDAVDLLELPVDIWERVEEARFHLARKGRQTSLVDLMIAATALAHEAPLWTLDDDFVPIRDALPFPRYLPELSR